MRTIVELTQNGTNDPSVRRDNYVIIGINDVSFIC